MPKLKVPGETLKKKFGPKKPTLSNDKKRDLIKSIHRRRAHEERKKQKPTHFKKNGLVRRKNDFYRVFGASDEEGEEWEGFQFDDLLNGEKNEPRRPLESNLVFCPESPVSSLSSLSPRSSPPPLPPPPPPSFRSPSFVGGGASTKHKSTPTTLRKRGARCMECPACLRETDCGKCVNCRDKPKFGGPNSRKQACIYRKCSNLLRDTPLKSTLPYKRPAADSSSVPSSKRPAKGDGGGGGGGGLVPSPLKPRRIVPLKTNKDCTRPMVQLYWPSTEALVSTCPVYCSPFSSCLSIGVCTRCGSHGNDPKELFKYCQFCSQPYHSFCTETDETTSTENTSTFTCPQCINCQVCGKTDKVVRCCECKRWFHPNCLLGHTSDLRADTKNATWRCVQCTKCRSCHRNTPNKIEGYGSSILSSLLAPTPSWSDSYCYCTDCYSLKAKGNSCPVCGECYLDNDFDSKMVQCSHCDSWVHSKCENMSDEEYEILSDLPDSVEFICKLCVAADEGRGLKEEGSKWREAIDEFKKESFNKIISIIKKSLGSLWINDINVLSPLVTVASFVLLINEHLGKCAKGVQTGSHKHRQLYTSQQNYNKELEELFPWFSLEVDIEEDTKETPPTLPPTPSKLRCNIEKWPGAISHDHDYMSCNRPTRSHDLNKIKSEKEESVAMETTIDDNRICILCTVKGDQPANDAGRLLPCGGIDEWIHVNCALWSAEVFEDENGYLCCVHSAIGRGQRLKCDRCHLYGATVGCCHSSCSSNYHYMCARNKNCIFLNNKEMYCHQHSSLCDKKERVPDENMRVDRCVLIHTDNDRPGRKINKLLPPDTVRLRIGSLTINLLGQLTSLSDTINPSLLVPHRFSSSSSFWSILNPIHRTNYTLTISALLPPEEPLPLPPPIKEVLPTSPEDFNWPCVSGRVNGIGHGLWSAVSSVDQILSSPSLTQTANMLLKASDGFPVSESLRSFRIPKKCHSSHTPSPVKEDEKNDTKGEVPPISSQCLSKWEQGLSTDMTGVQYSLTSEEGKSWNGSDLKDIWETVLSQLHEARRSLDLPYVPYSSDHVYQQFGLNNELVLQLLEQLPNQEKCSRHSFVFHEPSQPSNWQQMRAVINRTGSVRSEGYNGIRSETDMFSFLMSQWRPDPPQPDVEALDMAVVQAECQGNSNMRHQSQNDVPVAMRYRACQRTYRECVGVFTSRIHGLGLFCLQEIDSGDMVIEYAGTVIRSILTDYRERYYESRGIGCYMFRIDSDEVVDATMSGNMARFINHSCEPNCYSKVVAVDGQKKIMIFALRKIVPGEELTYDYKFPIEDSKIPCKCGAARCRKTLN